MKDRTLLVGGLSSLHDGLCAAALRSQGLSAVPLHPCTDNGLRRARALGNHGQCNPAHYSVGAVLEHAQASGEAPAHFAQRHAWLTLGSNGPCRLAAFGFEYQSPMAFGALATALKKAYGMSDEEVLFFQVHVSADEDHTGAIVRVLDKHATSEETREAIRQAAFTYAELYHGMLSTYEAFA